ncbi:winged helix-turn-helix transcriptional regulator [Bacillaceae bacterium Marseille-Q3522]|nr:winged helix-turn-helix transcriptional regulator [Bacillaceae bacterium Marseille-Q3522]
MKRKDHAFLSSDTVGEASRIFKALADPTRIKILYLLSQEECSVNHIAEVLELTQSAVSHQLSFLRNLRLVKYKREGNTFFYTYDDDHVLGILNQVISHIECEKEAADIYEPRT